MVFNEALTNSNAVCHQLTLMTGRVKNSHMHVKVKLGVKKVRSIEIHQVFAERNKVGYFSYRPRI